MKRYILFLGILVVALTAQAQSIVLTNGETIELNGKLSIRKTGYHDLSISTNEQTYTYDIRDIECIDFAASYTNIGSIDKNDTAIVYNEADEKVLVINGKNDAEITIFDIKGALIKRVRGNETNVGDLAPGLYIVNYNRKINAKILKK